MAASFPACASFQFAPISRGQFSSSCCHPSQFVAGQKLSHRKKRCLRGRGGTLCFCIKADMNNKHTGSFSHDLIESGEHFLDDVSHWISKKLAEKVGPHLPENFDLLDWIPSGLHSRIHSVERAATIFVRECLLLGIFYFLFTRVENFCRWLNWIHHSKSKHDQQFIEAEYHTSAYHAMADPLRAGVVLWEATRLLYVSGPLLKLRFGLQTVAKVRSVGFIVIITWFLLRWKNLVLEKLISGNKAEAPRYIAFDKVVSLLMYYIAGTCIGEVSGFALRSILAIGGVSGIAVGLAAKEIVGNFLGGTIVFLTRPFVIGDQVKAKSFAGYVEDIDFLHTKLIGFDRMPVIVPNQAILNEVITNYSKAKCRQLDAVFQLRNEDIFLVDKITKRITDYLSNHPKTDLENSHPPLCYLKAMGPDGLDIELLCALKEKSNLGFYKAKQEILVKAAEIVVEEGASLETSAQFILKERPVGEAPSM